MHLKQEVVGTFFGVCVYVDPAMQLSQHFTHPTIEQRVQSYKPEHDSRFAVVLPDEHHLLTFIIDRGGGVFVFSGMATDFMFRCPALWAGIGTLFGPDSVVHGVAYRGDARHAPDEMVLGVFDASRIRGEDLRGRAVLERHQRVHALMHAAGELPPRVHYHWLGYAPTCHANIASAPFTSHQMLVLNEDGVHERVLAPLRLRGAA